MALLRVAIYFKEHTCLAVYRDVNKAGSFKVKAKAKSLKARSLKAKTKAKARDQG